MSKSLFFDNDQIVIFREVLDMVPLTPRYLPFVVDMLQRLPESDAVPTHGPDSCRPAPKVPESGRGFQLKAHTPQGAAWIESLLARLPHSGDL
jgi:hypothetical protein